MPGTQFPTFFCLDLRPMAQKLLRQLCMPCCLDVFDLLPMAAANLLKVFSILHSASEPQRFTLFMITESALLLESR